MALSIKLKRHPKNILNGHCKKQSDELKGTFFHRFCKDEGFPYYRIPKSGRFRKVEQNVNINNHLFPSFIADRFVKSTRGDDKPKLSLRGANQRSNSLYGSASKGYRECKILKDGKILKAAQSAWILIKKVIASLAYDEFAITTQF